MSEHQRQQQISQDVKTLESMGYKQELHRGMSAFSNFAVSLSIICIVAGGLTSFHLGLCSTGGSAIGIGWPLVCLFSLTVAATMGQVASAFPTAGGLYHWSSILGGRGWGWATAWFNLAGLVTVLAAINVGTWDFFVGALGDRLGLNITPDNKWLWQLGALCVITFSQALVNHLGIRLTTLLTDFSGYLILVAAVALTVAMLVFAPSFEPVRLVTFTNYSGVPAEGEVWPATGNIAWLFALGFLLPAYTVTGFDASAHTSEETVGAAVNVPKGIVRSVLVSGVFGWVMLCAIVLAAPSLDEAAAQGSGAFFWITNSVVPAAWTLPLYVGIVIAQYLCGLATVTSASRMVFAFARDGGLPASLREVSQVYRTPVYAIWATAIVSVAFTVYTDVYSTITAACVIFLYISYAMPVATGFIAYGKTWTTMGPFDLGKWYKPLAVVSILGCILLFAIGMVPPNEKAAYSVAAMAGVLLVVWFAVESRRFKGPPQINASVKWIQGDA